MVKVLILLGSASDLPITEKGLSTLKELNVGFSLRIASAHRTPEAVHDIVTGFEKSGGKVVLCVAGMSAHLAGVVAAMTTLPVLAIPVAGQATAGFDSLLSMSQMPAGIPVGTMGFGKHGFTNAALLATQILALSDSGLSSSFSEHRSAMSKQVMVSDQENRVDFAGN
tara:strand:- start:313 stop:816 length:504 start_codon:yes stop_codon:yes gene_type:complete